MRYLVFGAGLQGQAIAHDLARHGGAEVVTVLDAEAEAVDRAVKRLRRLARAVRWKGEVRRVGGADAVRFLRGHDAAVSALPYGLNPGLAQAAVRAQVPFCDLGGHTDLVREELRLDRDARRAGIAIVPDCGIAPGLVNVLAALGVDEVEGARHVVIRCGGLPQEPEGPLDYRLTFSIEGLTNEYRGQSVVLRGGRLTRVEAFTECEEFRGPRALGRLEAFHTSGGASVAPWTFRGRLETYEYKTVRYAGHFAKVRAMIDLGLLALDPVEVDGRPVVPRAVWHAAAKPVLDRGSRRDLLFMRVDVTDDAGRGVRYGMLQRYDERTRFTAMEQCTGYPTATVAHALARRAVEPGARTPEQCGFDGAHVAELRRRGLAIRRRRI